MLPILFSSPENLMVRARREMISLSCMRIQSQNATLRPAVGPNLSAYTPRYVQEMFSPECRSRLERPKVW